MTQQRNGQKWEQTFIKEDTKMANKYMLDVQYQCQ